MTVLSATSSQVERLGRSWPLAVFFLIGIANAEFLNIVKSIDRDGLFPAIFATFDISLVQFAGIYVFATLLAAAQLPDFRPLDSAVLAATGLSFIAPISNMAWVAMTLCSAYFIYFRGVDSYFRRALVVLLGLCYTSFWSKLIFKYFLDYILRIDTVIVSFFSGTVSDGNLIFAADGKTTLQVLEGCSSFANISMAILGWLIARSYYGTQGARKGLLYIVFLTVVIIAINTARIGVIAVDPSLYDIAHGQFGASIANVLSAGIIAVVANHGAKS